MGSNFNPLSTILKDNKLTGPNFIDWKRNLNIVLTADNYKFVLTQPCPPEPEEGALERDVQAYSGWKKADEMTRCYMLASMSNILQHQHERMGMAYEMMMNLTDMFEDQNRSARMSAMHKLMNTKMAEGTPVRDHVIQFMGILNELEILGSEIDGETQVNFILQSLPNSFKQFRLNYTMNKLGYSLSQLLQELQAAERIQKGQGHQGEAMFSEKGTSSTFSKGKKRRRGKSQGKQAQKKGKKVVEGKSEEKVPKGKCFKCKKPGHWKKDCPENKARTENGKHFA